MKHGKSLYGGFMKGSKGVLAFGLALCLAGCGAQAEETGAQLETETVETEEMSAESVNSALNVFGGEDATPADGTPGQEDENGEQEAGDSSGQEIDATQDGGTAEMTGEEEDASATISPAQVKDRPEGWQLQLASEDWGLSFGESGTAPTGNASAEDLAWYSAYYVGDTGKKVIYLTFDCGYENGNTEPILDALKKHNVKGTFFVVGHFLETAPDMVKRMVEDGHTVGNHTYRHLDMPTISDMETFRKEMDDVADLFREITGKELSPFYRPPQGKCNEKNLEMAQELGYYTIFWSLAHVDWITDDQPGYEESIDKLTKRVHPGAIVLLHNTSQTNGEILDELLTKWEEMGYSFGTLAGLVSG